MNIKSISIKEGFFERQINFTEQVNLIYSEKNSKGKTTLVRFLLYGLGYNIPNTRNFKFDQSEVKLKIWCETNGEIVLFRNNRDYIIVWVNEEKRTYVLPEQANELHTLIYGTNNMEVLNNILGAFYVDQEKGWTLLNRGCAIGSNHFNIEELIRGLSNRDCHHLIDIEAKLSRELNKYRQMFSVAKYRETIISETGSLVIDDYKETSTAEINQLLLQQSSIKKELKRIDHVLNDNKRFKRFVSELKLLVSTPNGDMVQVTEDNIVGLTDTIDFLVSKRKMVAASLAEVVKRLERLQKEQEKEETQLAFFESESLMKIFDKKIASVPINAVSIEKEIKRLEKELKAIRQEISSKTKIDNDVAQSLYKNVVKYATELNVGDGECIAASYIFTSNLKELSGAVLHKMVFAFRLAYIIEIEKTLNIKLPIILDSPSGKEVDKSNVQLMVDILKRDFADNQIIIASIFEYNFENMNIIKIINRLVE